jgi:diacylglycerol kinase family enzyme
LVSRALILNPNSGSSRSPEEISDLFRSRGLSVEIFAADDPADAAARAHAAGFGTLIAAGGDGTVRSVAAVAAPAGAVLGVLPAGTLNHFAADLGIPTDVEKAVDIIAAGRTRQVDIAEVNGHFFINNSSLGLYPAMVLLRRTEERHGLNRWTATLRASLLVFLRLPRLDVRLTMNDAVVERDTPIVFVGNNEYGMEGLDAGKRQSLSGGQLFVTVAQATSHTDVILLALRALFGSLKETDKFDAFSTPEAIVHSRRPLVQVSLDGEVRRMQTPLHYRVHPGRLRVLAP